MEHWTLTTESEYSGLTIATTSPADNLKCFKHSGFTRKRRVALHSPSSGVCSATVNILDDMDAMIQRELVIAEDGRNHFGRQSL